MDQTNRRRRPLHLAVVKKQAASLETLRELRPDTDALDEAGLTTLDQAALDGEAGMAQLLIDRGAGIRLPAAVALRRTHDIERLLKEDPECLKPGQRWGTLIVRASERGPGDVIDTLIRFGASVDVWDDPKTAVDTTPRTPLHAAAWTGNAGAVAVLLEGPIDLFEALDFDLTARIPDILRRDPGALNRPFREHATCQPRHGQWWPDPWLTPLAHAVVKNKAEAARVLLEHGAELTVAPDSRSLQAIADEKG